MYLFLAVLGLSLLSMAFSSYGIMGATLHCIGVSSFVVEHGL